MLLAIASPSPEPSVTFVLDCYRNKYPIKKQKTLHSFVEGKKNLKHPLVLLEIKCPGHRVRFVVAIWCNQMLFQQANNLITSLHRTGYFHRIRRSVSERLLNLLPLLYMHEFNI